MPPPLPTTPQIAPPGPPPPPQCAPPGTPPPNRPSRSPPPPPPPKPKGHCPQSEAAAYSILVALFEKGRTDKTRTILLGKLKGILGGEEMSTRSGTDRQKQINKLMSEPQCRRRLGAVKDATGRQLSKPVQIATALKDHWEAVSTAHDSRGLHDLPRIPPPAPQFQANGQGVVQATISGTGG